MRRHLLSLLILAAAGTLAQAAHAEGRWRDPFAHHAPPAATAPLPSGEVAAAAPESIPPLRAILFDGSKSLVNIGGRILAVGESAAGYRLLKVDERSATLVKGGKRITLTLDKDGSR